MVKPVLLAVSLFLTGVVAHPFRTDVERPAAANIQRRTVDLNKFRLPAKAQYTQNEKVREENINGSIQKRADAVETATELVKKTFPDASFRVVPDYYTGDSGITHIHVRQTAHDLDIDNADFNINIAKDGSILSFGHSFFQGDIPAESPLQKRDFVDAVSALTGANNVLQLSVDASSATAEAQQEKETYTIKGSSGAVSDPISKLVYFQGEDGSLKLTWRVETDIYDNWLLSYVDAQNTERVHGVADYVADATYNVYPWTVNDPTKGSRTLVKDPADGTASEFGWHSTGSTSYTTTRGNNAIAQVNYEGDTSYLNDPRPDGSSSLTFDFPYSLQETDNKVYQNASVTQLFYTANRYHDLLYQLGFTEKAGNFESNNNNQGGSGNDFVILNAQDGSGTNNANFATPPDGQNGRMRMYMWTSTTPNRDCSFEAGVVLHEYTHGLSNRLTGGPANSNCLSATEAGGMGEGWSDFYALAIDTKTSDSRSTNMPLGAWVSGKANGIRQYLYSTSLSTNPLTYKSLNSQNEVHAIGTTWATILYEVMWNLIDKHGNTASQTPVYSNGVPTDGRYLSMKLVLDGMALQPCNPNFVQARDAIIDADANLTGGSNKCDLWKAFAKRGLGVNASRGTGTNRVEDYTLPSGC
ncbi:hypothetical protein EJ05DRAFT_432919 [Pseudovirgaria hyperparasitica]|uniref:Extracellular metalloproteinase n=1 Tax=Pseudovirgaria hyperparasitica TaxID=470096 RepID=A0A6A6WL50_9PEZI|nr:uncharacterized protein EJ05DRAFT_432919 [Pseudovirgaria hyperparasitica]KAF2762893.1 hypothetical protein EJ05DRAFT_432919 [Pseudovirgaria hyperparasitica]